LTGRAQEWLGFKLSMLMRAVWTALVHTDNKESTERRMKNIIRWLIACARPTSRMYRRDAVMRGLRGKLKVGRRVSRESMNER
jgi:hypothetical protein